MSLTLLIEEENPDIYLTKIYSIIPQNELVYHINLKENLNFKLEKIPYLLQRKDLALNFNWYTHQDNSIEHFVISNECFVKESQSSNDLFSLKEEIVTKQFLLEGLKKFNVLLLSPAPIENTQAYLTNRQVHRVETTHFSALKKKEQTIVKNIFYEKQG